VILDLLFSIPFVAFFHEAGHYAFGRRDGARLKVVKWFGIPTIGVSLCPANMTVFDYLALLFAGFAFSLPVVLLTSFVSLKLMLVLFLVAFGFALADFYFFFRLLFEVVVGNAGLEDRVYSVVDFNLKVFE